MQLNIVQLFKLLNQSILAIAVWQKPCPLYIVYMTYRKLKIHILSKFLLNNTFLNG